MGGHRFHAKGEKTAGSINGKLRATNQSAAQNHECKARNENTNPRRAAQVRKIIQPLRRQNGCEGNESEIPMLKECPQTIMVFPCLHSAVGSEARQLIDGHGGNKQGGFSGRGFLKQLASRGRLLRVVISEKAENDVGVQVDALIHLESPS